MNHRRTKDMQSKLLLIGMGLCLIACIITAINILILPTNRIYHSYIFPLMPIVFLFSMTAFLMIGRMLRMTENERLIRITRVIVPVYLAVLFIVHLIMGYLMEYKPSGDNFMIFNAAQMMAKDGNMDAYPDTYLYLSRFSNQWGFMLLLSMMYKLFFAIGLMDMFFPTVFIQALLYVGGMSAFFAIARRLRGERGVIAALAVSATCFPLYLAAAVIYTDTFTFPFVVISLFFILRALNTPSMKKTLLNALASAVTAAIGGQIKMTVVIVLIAATIVFFLKMPVMRAFCAGAMIWAVIGLSVFGVHKAMIGPVLDPQMVEQHNTPVIHWIMMSIPNGNNPYGNQLYDYYETWSMMEEGVPREQVMDSIYTRLIDKIYHLRYPSRLVPALLRKNVAAFGDGTFGMTEMLDDFPKRENVISSVVLYGRPYFQIYLTICTGIYCAHMVLAACACLRDIRRRDLRAAVLYIALFGFVFFLHLWEVRPRYVFNFIPILLLLSMGFIARGAQEGETNA